MKPHLLVGLTLTLLASVAPSAVAHDSGSTEIQYRIRYVGGSAGTAETGAQWCEREENWGCVGGDIPRHRRWLATVRVTDRTGRDVAAEILTFNSRDEWTAQPRRLCTRTEEPVDISSDTRYFTIALLNGPCEDGTHAQPTTGQVELILRTPR